MSSSRLSAATWLAAAVVLPLALPAAAQEAEEAAPAGKSWVYVGTYTGKDSKGIYRIPARVGSYRITVTLAGFSSINRTGVELLVGQTRTVNLQMAPSSLQETVTVTGEAPLIETTTSRLGGNIDPKQVQELPVAGRNWLSLALLAPGSRTSSTNATAPLPDAPLGVA